MKKFYGTCPMCGVFNEEGTTWLKEEDDGILQFCSDCRRIFKVKFSFDIKDEAESKAILDDLEKGVLLLQYRPNYFSGFGSEKAYARNYEEFIQIPWVKNFMNGSKEEGEFLHFYFSDRNDDKSIVAYRTSSLIVAQYGIRHWAVAWVFGDPEKVLGLKHKEVKKEKEN